MKLYLDMDGVLADFDKRAADILNMPTHRYEKTFGSQAFWHVLQSTPDFYSSFDLMLDAPFLFDAVERLKPTILTGLPMGDWAEPQKRAWGTRWFPGVPMITCRSKDKSLYCSPGDIIVDDRTEYRHLWEAKGGIWVHHTSAYDSIRQLRELRIID